MKTESDIKPKNKFLVNLLPCGMAEILFFENVENNGEVYVYDQYILEVPFRENLCEVVGENYDAWLLAAREAEAPDVPVITQEERISALEKENAELRVQLDTVMEAVDYILMEA